MGRVLKLPPRAPMAERPLVEYREPRHRPPFGPWEALGYLLGFGIYVGLLVLGVWKLGELLGVW